VAVLVAVVGLATAVPYMGVDDEPAHDHPDLPLPSNFIPVPLYEQKTDYSCGPSSALALLRYWDWATYANVTERELYGPMNCSKANGTDPGPIAAYINTYTSLQADYMWGEDLPLGLLLEAIDRQEPPIIDFEAWRDNDTVRWSTDWDDGHYNVLVGYDKDNFFMMDPSTPHRYAYVPQDKFLKRWHDVVGANNVHTWHMVVFVAGGSNPHPQPDPPAKASYED